MIEVAIIKTMETRRLKRGYVIEADLVKKLKIVAVEEEDTASSILEKALRIYFKRWDRKKAEQDSSTG